MNIREAFVVAVRALRVNKLRSILTTLGIIIGVSSVITLVGVGDGMRAGFADTFGRRANQLDITKAVGGVIGGDVRDLTNSDVAALVVPGRAPAVSSATPVVTGSTVASYRERQVLADVVGSTADYFRVANREVVSGVAFTATQRGGKDRVAVLGPNVAAALFPGGPGEAIGQTVRLTRTNFTVVGVLRGDGRSDDVVVVPIETARGYLVGAPDQVNQIIVKATSPNLMAAARRQVTAVLDEQHLIRTPSRRDFKISTFEAQLRDMNRTLGFISAFIVAIGGVSMLVGGIGVANIMLVSVTERTREIGIRKAIGARHSAIMKQFLIESLMLAAVGGVLGMVIGVGFTLTAAQVIPRLAPQFGAPTVSIPATVISFSASLVVGLLAGGYPAYRAARLRPVEALRHS
ncbi:ABC transporter permease [Pseudonocardia eucalypti]|uniref:ABC transporter permease n=1 Tax=Pseudonocardia eucalypti TaxID=648755 RepID=A0ABP9QCT6_9PSEU|nr:putative ABC transport system permease protein [Pseudonocardia eucalypti]